MKRLTKRQKQQLAKLIAGSLLANFYPEIDVLDVEDADDIGERLRAIGVSMLPKDMNTIPVLINSIIVEYMGAS